MKIWGARLFFLIIGGLCDGYMDKGCFFIERPDFILSHLLHFMSKIQCHGFFGFFCKASLTFYAKRTILIMQSMLCKSIEGAK